MKLLRFGPKGAEKPGLLGDDGKIRDLSGVVDDLAGDALAPEGLERLRGVDPASLPEAPEGTRLGAPVGRVGKLICIGLNYADHAAESGMAVPEEPVVFMKATSAIGGPFDPVVIPKNSQKTDWEVELGVVIGKAAKRVSEADALSFVAGYCTANDVSERALQTEGTGQWTKGKSCDTFGPLGPYLVTADEVPDPQNLKLTCKVNGETVQDGSTKTMVFGVAHLVSYLSGLMTLHPGDVISTGTPPGVGMGFKPPRFLKPGDECELEVEGLGVMKQAFVAEA